MSRRALVGTCTTSIVLRPPLDGVGFPDHCDFEPGFEPDPPQPAEAQCQSLPIFDARSLADCLTCWREAELNEFLKILYPCLVNRLPGSSALDCGTPPSVCPRGRTAARCSAAIGKAGIEVFLAEDQALSACLDEVRRGAIAGPCPDATAQAKIAAAEQRKERLLQRCTDMPPWWDVCPEDSTELCDHRIGSVADIATCVDGAAGAIAAEVVCEQYPRAAADGIDCPGREPFCGDGVVNQPSEQCDPPGSASCGEGRTCNSDCTCPSACLYPTVVPAAGGTVTGTIACPSTLSGSCGYPNASEAVFQWTPAVSGMAGVDSCSPTSYFFGVTYVRSGDCENGPELVCSGSCGVLFPVTAGQTYFIVADGYAPSGVTLAVSPPACASPVVIPPAGGTVTGTTAGASTLSASCNFSYFAPEQVFQWTPDMSGKVMIETCGGTTSFETILYMRSGDCETGPDLACNAYGCFPGAFITPTVTAGQTYFITVDGYYRDQGNFTLTVMPLFCGDGTVTPPEQCDPPGSVSCPDAQTCNADCTCPPPVCGNGVVAPSEQCDPPGSTTCSDGQACQADCTCPPPICGNGTVTPPETCDPPGSSCIGGQTCQADCTCPCHSECVAGAPMSPTCSSCAATVCRYDSFCCQVFWDRYCVGEAEHECGFYYCGH